MAEFASRVIFPLGSCGEESTVTMEMPNEETLIIETVVR